MIKEVVAGGRFDIFLDSVISFIINKFIPCSDLNLYFMLL